LLLFKKEKEYSKHLRERKHTNHRVKKIGKAENKKRFILKVKKKKNQTLKALTPFSAFLCGFHQAAGTAVQSQ